MFKGVCKIAKGFYKTGVVVSFGYGAGKIAERIIDTRKSCNKELMEELLDAKLTSAERGYEIDRLEKKVEELETRLETLTKVEEV